MDLLSPLLLVAGCAGGMGLMMWVMMRGQNMQHRQGDAPPPAASSDAEMARLRTEVEQLRAAQRDAEAPEERRPG